jgi:hypothetical protein
MDIILFCYTFYLQLCGMEAKQKPKEELMTIRIMVNISPKALEKNWGGSKKAARKAASNFVNNLKVE